MILHLKIIGVLLCLLSLLHLGFPAYFNWKEELSGLSLMNRQMMKVHTFFIALVVIGIGLLSFFQSNELTHTSFGQFISLGIGLFWVIRLIFQLFVYSPTLWKGKQFETVIHILFTFFWIYCSVVYLKIGLNNTI